MRPTREQRQSYTSVYFVTTQTHNRTPFFRHERWAKLMQATLDHYDSHGYTLHAWVIMPDHLHLLITPLESLEKAVQLFKGGFSYRAKRELGWNGAVWQPGFTDHRIRDDDDWQKHADYIRQNPLRARLAEDGVPYPHNGYVFSGFERNIEKARS